MSHLVAVREYTDAAQIFADTAARKARFAALRGYQEPSPERRENVRHEARPQPARAKSRSGLPWSLDDDAHLRILTRQDMPAGLIAREMTRSVGAVEGRAKKLGLQIKLARIEVFQPKPESIIAHYRAITVRPTPGFAKLAGILAAVADDHGVSVSDMKSEGKCQKVVRARQRAVWLLAQETTMSLAAIGRSMCRDHSTVIHSVRAENRRLGTNVRGLGEPKR